MDACEPSPAAERFADDLLDDLTTSAGVIEEASALAAMTSLRRKNFLLNFPVVEGAGSCFPERLVAK